jgi:hypothetical protein
VSKKKQHVEDISQPEVQEQPVNNQVNRFDLEQKFLNTWHVVDDIRLLSSRQATQADWEALCRVYDIRFDDTFTYFEQMIRERRIQ